MAESRWLSGQKNGLAVLGQSVAISGETAVLGVPGDGSLSGEAHIVMRRDGSWLEPQVVSSDAQPSDLFGSSVAIDGDTAVVGAPLAGRAFVFVHEADTWNKQPWLIPSDNAASARFGSAVAIDGQTIAVCAQGAIYVFGPTTYGWQEQQALRSEDGVPGFGASVSVEGDTLLAGAPDLDGNGNGAAYLFVRSGAAWALEQKLVPAAPHDAFGRAVSLSGDTALVASGRASDSQNGSSSVQVFLRTAGTWSAQQLLVPSEAVYGDGFGDSVSLFGDTALVGAPYANGPGVVYQFERASGVWREKRKLQPAEVSASASFGASVALSADTALVGAPEHFIPPLGAGAVYAFDLTLR